MNVKYRKIFLKELVKVPSKTRINIERFVFSEITQLDTIDKSGKIERMKGYSSYFKARFGSYRVGLKLEGDTVILERVLHRKDICRYFP